MSTKDYSQVNDPLAVVMSSQLRNYSDLLTNSSEVGRIGALTVRHDIGVLVTQVVGAALKYIRSTESKIHRLHTIWDNSPNPVLVISVGSTHGEAMASFADEPDFKRLRNEARELRGKLEMKNTEVCLSLPLH